MTHRLDVHRQNGSITFEVQGLLDPAALAELRVGIQMARDGALVPRVVLRAGTEVDHSCLAELRALGALVLAESPYLARWLAERGQR